MNLQVIEPKKSKYSNVFYKIKKDLAIGAYDECLIVTQSGEDIEVTPLVDTTYADMHLFLWKILHGFPDEP